MAPFSGTPDSRSSVWSSTRVLTPNESSLLPPSYLYFIFLLSLSSLPPFLSSFPVSFSAFHLAPCPFTLLHCFSFCFSLRPRFSPFFALLSPLPLSSVLNSNLCFLHHVSSSLLPLPYILPLCLLHLGNMKINEWNCNENKCMHLFEVIVSHSR